MSRLVTHFFTRTLRGAATALALAACALPALAAIPASERQVLIDLYNSTNGDNWNQKDNWKKPDGSFNDAGTECTWLLIVCDAARTHVTYISLGANLLTGTLPDTLNGLTALEVFDVGYNQLTGPIPSLTGLTALQTFSAPVNKLTGQIPSLAGLTALRTFEAIGNQLTGPIPSLTGLTALQYFQVYENQVTGQIPSLAGLTALETFDATYNQLTGPIPSLAGLTALRRFEAYSNMLTGTIPSLAGLTALEHFYVNDNQLTGTIPSLAGLTQLRGFRVHNNQLSGTPPAAPNSLWNNGADLCPNLLHTPSPTDAAWDRATATTPWSIGCTPGYLVSTSAGPGGSIGQQQGVVAGDTAALQVTPASGYSVDAVTSTCSGTLAGSTFTTGPVNADCTVSATFLADVVMIQPTTSVSPAGSGTLSCTAVPTGDPSVCTAVAAPGFALQGIEGCGGTSATSPYTTAPLTAACPVAATFLATAMPVPTLGQWALMALGLLVAGLGLRRVRGRSL